MVQAYSVGFSVAEADSVLYVGVGLWNSTLSLMKPAVIALNLDTGAELWVTELAGRPGQGHGTPTGVQRRRADLATVQEVSARSLCPAGECWPPATLKLSRQAFTSLTTKEPW